VLTVLFSSDLPILHTVKSNERISRIIHRQTMRGLLYFQRQFLTCSAKKIMQHQANAKTAVKKNPDRRSKNAMWRNYPPKEA